MNCIFDELLSRELIQQTTNYEKIKKMLTNEKITFYIGFDATADSLHIGHLIQLITMTRLQSYGHHVIALIGGATTLIGDPSGKNQLRKMMTCDEINYNANKIIKQITNFIDFKDSKNIILNNISWINDYKYIDFIRKFGKFFSVNRMIKADCFKSRLEKGLTFLEFNYTLLQSYDFLHLFKEYNCTLQIGGNDQWSNIIHGIDLVKKIENKEAFGLTLSLLTKTDGSKMGKTESGAIWLDSSKTNPYDFFQYWRNIDDKDVIKCMKFLTLLPLEIINNYEKDLNTNINMLKEKLAFEITKIVHGTKIAESILKQIKEIFTNKNFTQVNKFYMQDDYFCNNKINIVKLLNLVNFVKSNTEARKLILQSGIRINNKIITDTNLCLDKNEFNIHKFILQKGKKHFIEIILK